MFYKLISDSKKCFYCDQEAKCYCTCKNPDIYFCNEDRNTHESFLGDQSIKLNKIVNMSRPNLVFKRNLAQEIIKTRLSAEDQMKKVIKASAETIRLVQNETKETMVKLHRFVSLCNDILSQIYSIESISPKQIYSPIEALLLFEDFENIIKKIKAPTIEIAEVPIVFSYIPTTFPRFLYNFSDTNISFPVKEGVIQVSNPENTIKNEKPSFFQSCLSLQNKKVLMTGGSLGNNEITDTFILDILSGLITEISRLICPRKSHSMVGSIICHQ